MRCSKSAVVGSGDAGSNRRAGRRDGVQLVGRVAVSLSSATVEDLDELPGIGPITTDPR
jgi:hypothetical protein